jgi:hypothetical protein
VKPKRRAGGEGAVLLAGGNPQIPKGEGDAPVQAYLAAVPGWKRPLAKRLDARIVAPATAGCVETRHGA